MHLHHLQRNKSQKRQSHGIQDMLPASELWAGWQRNMEKRFSSTHRESVLVIHSLHITLWIECPG
jgi:predicted alpha/beta hydrolase family esterase